MAKLVGFPICDGERLYFSFVLHNRVDQVLRTSFCIGMLGDAVDSWEGEKERKRREGRKKQVTGNDDAFGYSRVACLV